MSKNDKIDELEQRLTELEQERRPGERIKAACTRREFVYGGILGAAGMAAMTGTASAQSGGSFPEDFHGMALLIGDDADKPAHDGTFFDDLSEWNFLYFAEDTGARYISRTGDTSWQLLDLEAGAVETKKLDNVRYASNFSGSNGRAQIQAAIDDLSGHGVVVVGPEGPDDVSSSSGATSDGRETTAWAFASDDDPLSVPSNVTLIFKNSYLYIRDNGTDGFIRNATHNDGTSDRNSDISIRGHGDVYLDMNPANFDGTIEDQRRAAINLHKVDNVRVSGLRIESDGWQIGLQNVTNAHVTDIITDAATDETDKDVIHCVGPVKRITAHAIRGQINGDCCIVEALGTGSNSVSQQAVASGGECRDISFSNVHVDNLNAGSLLTTIPSGTSGEVIDGVTISNSSISSADTRNVLHIGVRGAPTTTFDKHRNITAVGVTGDGNNFCNLNNKVRNLRFANCTHKNSRIFFRNLGGGGNGHDIDGLWIENCNHHNIGGKTTNGTIRLADATVGRIHIDDYGARVDNLAGTVDNARAVSIESTLTIDDQIVIDGITTDTIATGIEIESGVTLNAPVKISDFDFLNGTTKYDLGEKLGVLIDGHAPTENEGGTPTYTGDGSSTQSISLGFRPTYVVVVESGGTIFDIHDNSEFGTGYLHSSPSGSISLTSSGFDVGDGGSDADPNTDTETYDVYYEA